MTLKTVLCNKDMVLNTICNECTKKLEKKEFSSLDVNISHKLGKLSKIFPLTNIEFKKAIDLQDLIVLACTGNIGSLIGTRGKIVSEITKHLGKTVRIIEHTKNEKKMIQDLIGNARLLGIKKIFNPDFIEYKVIILNADKDKLIAPQKKLEEGLESLLEAKAAIEFE